MASNKTLLLSTTMFAGFLLASPSFAQTATTTPDPANAPAAPVATAQQSPDEAAIAEETAANPEAPASADGDSDAATVEGVVVTGSRLRRTEFTSAAPIQVITSESAELEGNTDIAETLQQSSLAAGSNQINNTFTGLNVNGGGGVNTISLRGLGATRTLVLMNGRRLPPAGTQGAVAAVDLNILPNTVIERTEILKDGASSIYGSDAVSGVVNVITRKNLDGFVIDADVSEINEHGGGERYSAGLGWGKLFERGRVQVSGEYYRQNDLDFGSRDDFFCEQPYVFTPGTTLRADIRDPKTGDFKCTGPSGGVYGYVTRLTPDGVGVASRFLISQAGPPYSNLGAGYQPSAADPLLNNLFRFAPFAERPMQAEVERTTDIISEVERFTAFADADYDLGFGEAYGEFLYHRRKSNQDNYQQIFPDVAAEAPCSVNIFNCPQFGTPGRFAAGAHAVSPSDREQDVEVYRLLGGVRGNFGDNLPLIGGWDWDGYATYSKNKGQYTQIGIAEDRFEYGIGGEGTSINLPNNGFFTVPGQTPGVPCAGTSVPAGCRPINLFSDFTLNTGTFTEDDLNYLRLVDSGETEYKQTQAEFQMTGDLFTLPAGPVGAALGFYYRKDEINDQPGAQMIAVNFYNSGSEQVTTGTDSLKELYGELEIPILRDVPFFKNLAINLSGRASDYESYGRNNTYRVTANWSLTDWLRLRYTQGTSFRAPSLFQLFRGASIGFLGQSNVDPCIRYAPTADNPGSPNANVRANCAAQGIPGTYAGVGSSAQVDTKGNPTLAPEESESFTAGIIFTPTFADFSLAVDYFEIDITGAVTSDGAAVVGSCYRQTDFDPATAGTAQGTGFCGLFRRTLTPGSPTQFQITSIDNAYRNIAAEAARGIDVAARYRRDLGAGRVTANVNGSWNLETVEVLFEDLDSFKGHVGSPEFVGNGDVRYDVGPWTATWSFDFIGRSSNHEYIGTDIKQGYIYSQGFVNVAARYRTEPIWYHHLSARYRSENNWSITAGVQNVFDERPPAVSAADDVTAANGTDFYRRLGNYPRVSQYDFIGRSAFVSVRKEF